MNPKAFPPEVKVNSVTKTAMIEVARRVANAGHTAQIICLRTLFPVILAIRDFPGRNHSAFPQPIRTIENNICR
jgi:hypothetical protein